jgi:hypothetical protein
MYKTPVIRFGDEIAWIGGGYFYELLLKKDFKNPLWQTTISYDQPKFTYYYYAALLYPDYLKMKNKPAGYDYAKYLIDNNFYWMRSSFYQNYRNKNINFIDWKFDTPLTISQSNEEQKEIIRKMGPGIKPTIAMIYKSRFINVILLSLTVVLVFLLTRKFSNLFIAIITAIIFGSNYLITQISFLAQGDGLFNFLFLLSTYLLLILVENLFRPGKRFIISLLALSITLPVLNQTKLNGVMMLFFSIALLTIVTIFSYFNKKTSNTLRHIFSILVIISMSISIFLALDPYLYSDTINRVNKLYSYRKEVSFVMGYHQGGHNILNTPYERINAIYQNFYLKDIQHCRYNEVFFLRSFCLKSLVMYKYFKIVLLFTGIYYCLKNIVRNKSLPVLFIFSLFFFLQLMISLYLFLNWDRYFIQLVYFFIFFQVSGLYYLLRNISNIVSNISPIPGFSPSK